MAKFTSTADLNIRLWPSYEIVGVAGTTYRIPDALAASFDTTHIPGFAWVTQDEIGAIVTPATSDIIGLDAALAAKLESPIAQTDVTGLTAALAGKYDKTGGTISGAVTVTGVLIAQSATTVGGALVAQGSATVAANLHVDGNATIDGNATFGAEASFAGVITAGSTAFPVAGVATNDHFYRTDLGMWFFYDGTRWLSEEVFVLRTGSSIANLSITNSDAERMAPLPRLGGSDIWLATAAVG